MKWCRLFNATLAFTLLTACTQSALSIEKEPRIRDLGQGIYSQFLKGPRFFYMVDTKTQLCFFNSESGSATNIDCNKLANRKSWASIITWK